MRLFIIRHGQTEWNFSYRLQGQTDIPLNENGRELARITGKAMARQGIRFDRVFTSPLSRARETAELVVNELEQAPQLIENTTSLRGIAEKMISGADDNTESMWNARYITEDERIQEISFGEKEGKRVRDENGKLIDPDIICFFQETEKYLPPKGAESFEMLLARTGDFLEELKRKACSDSEQDANILVSTHGAASRALLANITHCPLRDFWCGGVPKNCAVTIVDLVNGEWKIKEQDIIYYGNENI